MKVERIYLGDNEKVYLDAYIANPIKDLTRKAILVIPGGGYLGLAGDREGEPIAMAFLPYGYNAFVLSYNTAGDGTGHKVFPTQLIQASKAMKHIKDHAEEYHIDPEQVFVTGFSAGGHLAGCLGTMWHMQEIYDEIDMPFGYNKPAGMMLCYPVVSGVEECSHTVSMGYLWREDNPSKENLLMSSVEKHVDERSCPAYIMHTANDQIVDVRNSLVLAKAYADAGMPFELHIYPDGPHGMALGNHVTRCGNEKWENAGVAKWVENACFWADSLAK